MEGAVELITQLGFAAGACILLGFAFYKIIFRIMDENKDREQVMRGQAAEMIKANNNFSNALKDVANTINTSNETNRLLVDKVDVHLANIDESIRDINIKLEGGGQIDEHNTK